jgi:hypothetical protein
MPITDEKPTTIEALPRVTLATVDTGHGLADCTKATTPRGQPNIIVRVIPKVIALANRFAFTFGGQLSGLLAAAMTPAGAKLLYTSDFWHLLVLCSSLSLPWAVASLVKDLVTLSKNLEGKYPLLTGNA